MCEDYYNNMMTKFLPIVLLAVLAAAKDGSEFNGDTYIQKSAQ